MLERPISVTELVNARIHGQGRKASRGRVGRQDFDAKRRLMTSKRPCFLSVAERDGLVERLQASIAAPGASLAHVVMGERALKPLLRAEPSYRRPDCVAVLLTHQDAVLLGNVLRRLGGSIPGLARIDKIACRRAS